MTKFGFGGSFGNDQEWKPLRLGKSECVWQEDIELPGIDGPRHQPRRVYRLTERTIDKHGSPLLMTGCVFSRRRWPWPGVFCSAV